MNRTLSYLAVGLCLALFVVTLAWGAVATLHLDALSVKLVAACFSGAV